MNFLGSGLLKILFCTVAYLSGINSTAGADITSSNKLDYFRESNFGSSFSHTTNLTISYNPHGGADRVILKYRQKAIGGLLIRPAPNQIPLEDFIEGGKSHFKSQGAKSVDYESIETTNKHKFHHLKAEIKRNDSDYILERFVHLREASKGPLSADALTLRSLSGAFSFEFLYLKADMDKLKTEIKTVIDTFKLGNSN